MYTHSAAQTNGATATFGFGPAVRRNVLLPSPGLMHNLRPQAQTFDPSGGVASAMHSASPMVSMHDSLGSSFPMQSRACQVRPARRPQTAFPMQSGPLYGSGFDNFSFLSGGQHPGLSQPGISQPAQVPGLSHHAQVPGLLRPQQSRMSFSPNYNTSTKATSQMVTQRGVVPTPIASLQARLRERISQLMGGNLG